MRHQLEDDLGRTEYNSDNDGRFNNFTKGVKISPDGLCMLVNSDDNILRLFDFPTTGTTTTTDEIAVSQRSVLQMKEGSCIYDFQFYPFLNSSIPESCLFLSSSQGNPVHLWDAYSGKLRASYCPRNDVDEIAPAYSIAFTATGEKIITGHNRMIKLFDTQRPTETVQCESLHTPRKSKTGQRGIISTIHSNPDYSKIYAAGSYNGSTVIYSEDINGPLMELERHSGGVNQVQFSADGKFLFTAARKDPFIRQWDIRNTGEILNTFERLADTNQKICFDINSSGTLLASGSQYKNDQALIFETKTGELVHELNHLPDTVNGVSFSPGDELKLATCTGKRYFQLSDDKEEPTKNKNTVQIWKLWQE